MGQVREIFNRPSPIRVVIFMRTVVLLTLILVSPTLVASIYGEAGTSIVLEDFQSLEADGFPVGWNGQRSKVTAMEAYSVHQEDGAAFLKGKGANQRVYTKSIQWNPKTHPILRWRWRLVSVPEQADFMAGVFANLDTDFLLIPVSTKYVWSGTKSQGTITDGGMFGAAEVVLRSGSQPIGEWVTEEVNAYEDFKEIHQHEPADQAWGISLQSGPGVEIDFGALEISTQ